MNKHSPCKAHYSYQQMSPTSPTPARLVIFTDLRRLCVGNVDTIWQQMVHSPINFHCHSHTLQWVICWQKYAYSLYVTSKLMNIIRLCKANVVTWHLQLLSAHSIHWKITEKISKVLLHFERKLFRQSGNHHVQLYVHYLFLPSSSF